MARHVRVNQGETEAYEWPENKHVILFAGNVGRFQGLQGLIRTVAKLQKSHDLALVIMGEGVLKESLERLVGELQANVHFIDQKSIKTAKAASEKKVSLNCCVNR